MKQSSQNGFTLVEIMIVVSIIGLLAAIATPSFMKARTNARKNACISNQRVLDAAIAEAALEYGWDEGYEIQEEGDPEIILEYIKGGTNNLICPDGGDYRVQFVGSNTSCSIPGHSLVETVEEGAEEPDPVPVPVER